LFKVLVYNFLRHWLALCCRIINGEVHCELSLDPEVATLFGREIGQSNGDILLTIYDDSKDKSRPVTCIAKCCFITSFTFL
jgi:hypothetical protein